MTTSVWLCGVSLLCLAISIHGRFQQYEFDSSELFQHRRASDFTADQRQMQDQALKAHNLFRTRHCVPSLVLDEDLNRSAQQYAEQLAQSNRFEHSDAAEYGENLFVRTSSADIRTLDGQKKPSFFYKGLYRFVHSRCYTRRWLVQRDQTLRLQESSVLSRGRSLHAIALERLEETRYGFCSWSKWHQTKIIRRSTLHAPGECKRRLHGQCSSCSMLIKSASEHSFVILPLIFIPQMLIDKCCFFATIQ